MPDFNAWLGSSGELGGLSVTVAQQRAALAWRRINDKPSSVAFKPPTGATLAAQTVRLEYDDMASPAESAAGAAPKRKLTIFGVKDHATVTDTAIKEGYRFVYATDEYRITDLIYSIGEVQAIAETVG